LAKWNALAAAELKGKPPSNLDWHTPEASPSSPFYTEPIWRRSTSRDFPGATRSRGAALSARAAGDDVRQPAVDDPAIFGVFDAEESNRFYRDNLKAGQMGLSIAFDLATIAAMTATIRASSAMSARPASRSTASRT